LAVSITDTETGATFSTSYGVNLINALGSTTAYIGFTGATGGLTATQEILNWTYQALPYFPTFTPDDLVLNGGAQVRDNRLRLIDSGVANEARSAYFLTPVNVQTFTNDFTFAATNVIADGFTFVLQNDGPNAVGPSGGGLGYGPMAGGSGGVSPSVAVKFDLYSNIGEGTDSTGLYTDAASPTMPAIDLTGTGINLHSEDPIKVHMVYNGTILAVTLTDTVTGAVANQSYTVNIPSVVGGSSGYVGFTGGTGSLSASEDIVNWTYVPFVAAP
jgi:hypothetical protein